MKACEVHGGAVKQCIELHVCTEHTQALATVHGLLYCLILSPAHRQTCYLLHVISHFVVRFGSMHTRYGAAVQSS
jgi:hypothetical protein